MEKTKKVKRIKKGLISGDTLEGPTGRTVLIPRIEALFSTVICSAHSVKSTSLVVGLHNSLLSYDQVVVAVGPNAQVKVGDWVRINVDMFPVERKPGKHDIGTQKVVIPPLEKIGNTEYLYLSDRHIKFILKKDDSNS